MTMRFLVLCAIAAVLAACTDPPQPAMQLRPVTQVTLDMAPSRVIPHTLMPTAR